MGNGDNTSSAALNTFSPLLYSIVTRETNHSTRIKGRERSKYRPRLMAVSSRDLLKSEQHPGPKQKLQAPLARATVWCCSVYTKISILLADWLSLYPSPSAFPLDQLCDGAAQEVKSWWKEIVTGFKCSEGKKGRSVSVRHKSTNLYCR